MAIAAAYKFMITWILAAAAYSKVVEEPVQDDTEQTNVTQRNP